MTQKQLAEALGISQVAVSRWEKGVDRPSGQALIALGRLAPDSEKHWWFEQGGVKPHDLRNEEAVDDRDLTLVPLLKDAVAAGTPRQVDENEIERRIPMLKEWLPRSGKIVALKVSGDSMDPIIQHGHIVLVDTTMRDATKLVEKMVAAREGDGVTIKWLRKDGPHYMLVPQHTALGIR